MTLPVQMAHVQINLTVPSITPVTVHYATQDSDARAGLDYTAMSGTLTIPAGDTDALLDIPILATDLTTARSFTVNLSSPTIAQLNLVKSLMITINPPEVSGPPRVILTASTPNAEYRQRIDDLTGKPPPEPPSLALPPGIISHNAVAPEALLARVDALADSGAAAQSRAVAV